jgi:2-keto-4-pentenoate hydratase/2-oxohepta-3-ene-1,7-dioic acid hydratase in catechol pathway
MARDPQRYLKPGGTLVSTVEGIGSLSNRMLAGPDSKSAA